MSWNGWFDSRMEKRGQQGLVRSDQVHGSTADHCLIDASSNDMLGLAHDPGVIEAAQQAATRYGTGARASRVVTGTSPIHHLLEDALCSLTGAKASVAFSSGYAANLGLLQTLGTENTVLIYDQHVHASTRDAIRLARATSVEVPHQCLNSFRRALETHADRRRVVVVESVYSVLSDVAPMVDLAQLCEEFNAMLCVDEAHSLGLRGQGRGLLDELGMWQRSSLQLAATVTLSKALGSQGGAVCCSASLRELIVNCARTFIFDTALSPPNTAAALAATRTLLTDTGKNLAERAWGNACELAARLDHCLNVSVPQPEGVVVSVPVTPVSKAINTYHELRNRGILVGLFRPPSVPDGVPRLRISTSANHSHQDIDRIAEELSELLTHENKAERRC